MTVSNREMSDAPHRAICHRSREIKFLIDAPTARAVRQWAREHLLPDTHGTGPLGDEYHTSTLYFDTTGRHVFHRIGSFGRSKYRVRRYGPSDVAFFERKLRTNDLVVKRRTASNLTDLSRLHTNAPDASWPAHWFHRRLRLRRLRPICRINYVRMARVAATPSGPIRLTVDETPTAAASDDFEADGASELPILADRAILELKFNAELPGLFKRLAERFHLVPQSFSKYRVAVGALGLAEQNASTSGHAEADHG